MQGINGSYIRAEDLTQAPAPRTFRLHDALDTSLASVAQRCLVLASHYSAVTAFVHGIWFAPLNLTHPLTVSSPLSPLSGAQRNAALSTAPFCTHLPLQCARCSPSTT